MLQFQDDRQVVDDLARLTTREETDMFQQFQDELQDGRSDLQNPEELVEDAPLSLVMAARKVVDDLARLNPAQLAILAGTIEPVAKDTVIALLKNKVQAAPPAELEQYCQLAKQVGAWPSLRPHVIERNRRIAHALFSLDIDQLDSVLDAVAVDGWLPAEIRDAASARVRNILATIPATYQSILVVNRAATFARKWRMWGMLSNHIENGNRRVLKSLERFRLTGGYPLRRGTKTVLADTDGGALQMIASGYVPVVI